MDLLWPIPNQACILQEIFLRVAHKSLESSILSQFDVNSFTWLSSNEVDRESHPYCESNHLQPGIVNGSTLSMLHQLFEALAEKRVCHLLKQENAVN